MALLEYRQRDSFLHLLHPAAKGIWIITMGVVLSIYFDPIPLGVILLLNLPFYFLGRIPWKRWLKPLGIVLFLGMIGYFVVSLFLNRPGVFTRYPDISRITLISIASERFFLGSMSITVGGIMYTLGQTIRSITLVFMVAVFVYSTAPSDLVYILNKLHIPHKLVFIVMVAYRFFPHIFHKLNVVIAAQRLRGWELSSRNPIKLARQYLPIIIPVFTEVVRISEYTTKAVESRAFGKSRFVLHRELNWGLKDSLFSVLWLAIAAIFLYLYIVHQIGVL